MELMQWGIPIIVGILTFFVGRIYERQKIAQANRLGLLKPVEEWIDQISRLIGIVGSAMTAISLGLPFQTQYGFDEIGETAKALGEKKEKVMGILQSKALNTREARKLSVSLTEKVGGLSVLVERELLPAYYVVLDQSEKNKSVSPEMMRVVGLSARANALIREIHSTLAALKTKYN